jgi:hypothetical protein
MHRGGGSFTTVIYQESAVIVDWILIPQEQARRPDQCQLLFQKIPIPVQSSSEPESIEQRVQLASQQVAFFWFMAAVIAKYLVRRDALQFNAWLHALRQVMVEVERLVIGEPWQYLPEPPFDLALTPAAQKAALRQLCHEMLSLMPAVGGLGGRVPEDPMPIIEARLALLEDNMA